MSTRIFSSREFTRDVAAAKAAALTVPVLITDRGHPAFVMLDIDEYHRLQGRAPSQFALMQQLPALPDDVVEIPRAEIERGPLIEQSRGSAQAPVLRTWFNALRIAYAGRVLPFNAGAAIRAAQLAGGDRPSVDLMNAAIALEFGYAVAMRNVPRFDFAGLAVVDPWA